MICQTPKSRAFGGLIITGDNMKKELIKQRDVLITGGTGVCLFGLWSVIRVVMSIITNAPETRGIFEQTESFFSRLMAVIVLFIVAALVIAIHLYIGLSSRAEGFRPRKRKAYIVATVLFTILHIITLGYDVFSYDVVNNGYIAYAVTICVDVALIFTLFGIVIASFRIRWLQKRMREGRNE